MTLAQRKKAIAEATARAAEAMQRVNEVRARHEEELRIARAPYYEANREIERLKLDAEADKVPADVAARWVAGALTGADNDLLVRRHIRRKPYYGPVEGGDDVLAVLRERAGVKS